MILWDPLDVASLSATDVAMASPDSGEELRSSWPGSLHQTGDPRSIPGTGAPLRLFWGGSLSPSGLLRSTNHDDDLALGVAPLLVLGNDEDENCWGLDGLDSQQI